LGGKKKEKAVLFSPRGKRKGEKIGGWAKNAVPPRAAKRKGKGVRLVTLPSGRAPPEGGEGKRGVMSARPGAAGEKKQSRARDPAKRKKKGAILVPTKRKKGG